MVYSSLANDFLISLVDNSATSSAASTCFPSSSSVPTNSDNAVNSDQETITSNRLDLALCLRTLQYLPGFL